MARKFSGARHSSQETRGNVHTGTRLPDERVARARTEEYYECHARMVGGLCLALLRDRTEAEDATQQVFLSAYRALLGGSEPREPPAWLATIARNECRARMRSRTREPIADADPETAPSPADPLAEAIRRADLTAMWAAVEQLPRQQRDALLLRVFGGLSYDELAAALSVTTPAVESLLFRARRSLRARLEPVYGALTGASWIESLARIFAASAPAAATKAVAIGLGAAAVTGGAVLAPQMIDPGSTRPHRPVTTGAATPRPRPPATVASVPATFSMPVSHRPEHTGTSEQRSREPADASGADTAPSGEHERAPATVTTPEPERSQPQTGDGQETGDGASSGQSSGASGDD